LRIHGHGYEQATKHVFELATLVKYDQLNLEQLEELLIQNRRNLHKLEIQIAQYGGLMSAPLLLMNQRELTKDELNLIQATIDRKTGNQTLQQSNTSIQQQSANKNTSNQATHSSISNPKLKLNEPRAIIIGAIITALATILVILKPFGLGSNDTFNYQVEVLDTSTNKPIGLAKVTITLPNLAPLEAFSDNNGFARLSIGDQYNDQAGILRLEKTGYDSVIFNVDIQADRLPKQIKLTPNQSNTPQPTATEAAAAATPETGSGIPTAGGATAPLLIGCWNNDSKPRNITNINIRESADGIKIGFKANCADSAITDEQDAVISAENEIRLSQVDETWTFSLRPDGTLRLAIEGQTGFEELTFYKK